MTGTPFAVRRAAHLRLGRRGERLAGRLLRELGLDVLVRNYRGPGGEIDLVARDGAVLCFVEVKTRAGRARSRPADAVGRAKRRRIIRAAHRYLRDLGSPEVRYRYDIVELVLHEGRVADARYWRQAFTEEVARDALRFPSAPSAVAEVSCEGNVAGGPCCGSRGPQRRSGSARADTRDYSTPEQEPLRN
jgi:putative endonuclease